MIYDQKSSINNNGPKTKMGNNNFIVCNSIYLSELKLKLMY